MADICVELVAAHYDITAIHSTGTLYDNERATKLVTNDWVFSPCYYTRIKRKKAKHIIPMSRSKSTRNSFAEKPSYEEEIDEILHLKKIRRAGSHVFCVGCGALNVTLYKWRNSYICRNCKKHMETIGEEAFIKAFSGKENHS